MLYRSLAAVALLATTACTPVATANAPASAPASEIQGTGIWPDVQSRVPILADQEAQISAMIERMTVEEKVAQTI